jgi:hypothetical protein
MNQPTPEHVFGSTTWAWKRVRISRPAGGQGGSAAKLHRFWGLPPRDPRSPLHLTVKYRGGAECWVEVHARGRIARYVGSTALADLVFEVNQNDR